MIKKISSDKPDTGPVKNDLIDCFSCIYFYITYDKHFPYGCRAAGFKSQFLPSRDMYENSGITCQLYQEKKKSF